MAREPSELGYGGLTGTRGKMVAPLLAAGLGLGVFALGFVAAIGFIASANKPATPEIAAIGQGDDGEVGLVLPDQQVDAFALMPVERTWPRLKPRRGEGRAGVAPAIRVSQNFLSSAAPAGIVAADDITGMRSPLLQSYADAKRRDRTERSYETVALARGLSFAETLVAVGADEEDVALVVAKLSELTNPDTLEPGSAIDYAFATVFEPTGVASDNESGSISYVTARRVLARVRLRPEDRVVVTVWRQSDGTYTAEQKTMDIVRRYAAVAGVIRHSLFEAAQRSDVPPEIMARFANLFLYDVDFARDIHDGDKFEAVYEVFFDTDGRYIGSGDIVFAGMTWRGGRGAKAYYRFAEPGFEDAPYFDSTGESAMRLLMKTPIEGAKVTSGFGQRKHPILGYSKDHKGVDFGAPRGTPIMAAGDGRVERAAPTGSFGNFIKIVHAHGYETSYAHLDRFAKGIAPGTKVRQGQVIGYVGSTGRSTGPHLHYEVARNGDVKNPMTLEVANGRTLEGRRRTEFNVARETVDAMRVYPFAVSMASSD